MSRGSGVSRMGKVSRWGGCGMGELENGRVVGSGSCENPWRRGYSLVLNLLLRN